MPLIQVLKWDSPPNVFAYRFPNAELNTKSQLIVSEAQEAVFLKEGRFYATFGPGRHVLDTKNFPFLTAFVTSLVSDGVSPFTAEVWFVNKAIPLNIKWGTPDPIQVEDPKYHIWAPIRAFGYYGIQIADVQTFLAKLVGRVPVFTVKTLTEYFKGIMITQVKDVLGDCIIKQGVSVLEVSSKLASLSDIMRDRISERMAPYGVRLVEMSINSITTDESDPGIQKLKNAMANKAEMDILGYTYQQKRSFDTMETAAGNQGSGGSLLSAGMGLGMGVGVGQPMGSAMGGIAQHIAPNAPKGVEVPSQKNEALSTACSKCGAALPKGARFCPSCGDAYIPCPDCGADNDAQAAVCRNCRKPLPKPCMKCGTLVTGRFCRQCGAPLKAVCPNCGIATDDGVKFCPDCGTKIAVPSVDPKSPTKNPGEQP